MSSRVLRNALLSTALLGCLANTATSTLAYRCTSGTAPEAALTYDFMTNGGTGVLNYTLYQDTTGTVWDDTSTQTLPTATGFNSVDTVTVYGEVTSAEATADGVENGVYVDEVTVTLTF